MAGQSSAVFSWSWTEVNVLGSQVVGKAFMESCDCDALEIKHKLLGAQLYRKVLLQVV